MSRIAIQVEGIGKSYSQRPTLASHVSSLCFRRTPMPQSTWALRDVNFEVPAGTSVGIIGLNGSGKTTLLEIIAGTLTPTSGTIIRNGRVAALLELSSGFDPALSGKENIFLNGMVSGLSRALVEKHFDEIVRFADIGDVLGKPVKTYSSGMLARLAFSLHTVLVPDILIIDEILAVGDYFFQQKCYRRLAELREAGVTLLFVSHDLSLVRDMCQMSLYLRAGQLAYKGPSDAAIHQLLTDGSNEVVPTSAASNVSTNSPHNNDAVWRRDLSETFRFIAIRIVGDDGKSSVTHTLGNRVVIQACFRTFPGDDDLVIGLSIKNRYDQTVTSINSAMLNCPEISHAGEEWRYFEFELELLLEGGEYSLRLGLNRKPLSGESGYHAIDTTNWFGPLRVIWNYEENPAPFLGMFGLPMVGRLGGTLSNVPRQIEEEFN
ncbi:MAG: ABC transporter ATP-binding protein [Pseudomonadota bacterium]